MSRNLKSSIESQNIASHDSQAFIQKLPMITLSFWVIKITATTLGETGGDWLSQTMGWGYLWSTLIFLIFLASLLVAQLLVTSHRPFLYWSVIVATSTAGTTMSDALDRSFQWGYTRGMLLLLSLLLVVLGLWKLTTGSLSVALIRTRRAELFYWLAILLSNTLGTALGDFLSEVSGLGFLGSWILITSLLLAISIVHFISRQSVFDWKNTFLFWSAFILTRPFGATFGDLLTKTPEAGGLNWGTGRTSLVLLTLAVIFIAATTPRTQGDSAGSNKSSRK